MENATSSRAEAMKPIVLKAGIPFVLSVAGFIYARIYARKSVITVTKSSSIEAKVSSQESIDAHEDFRDEAVHDGSNSATFTIKNEEDCIITRTHVESSNFCDEEETKMGSINRVEELQNRLWELENQFLRYHVMKEQEIVLLQFKNMLELETAHVEFLEREISSMKVEKQRFESLVMDYVRVLEQMEVSKMENELLQKKVEKLLRKSKHQFRVIAEQNLKIEDREAEILRCRDVVDTRNNVIKKLECEVKELQIIIYQLQEEKNDLLIKLKSAGNSASGISKVGAEGVTMEDYNNQAKELERLRRDRAAETTEVIYLRWTNACLRHELMRVHQQQRKEEEIEQKKIQPEMKQKKNHHVEPGHEQGGEIVHCSFDHQQEGLLHGETYLDAETGNHAHPKRKKLLQKLKKWVEGSENLNPKLDEKEKLESKCFGRHSVSEEPEEVHIIQARRSCSST